MIERHYTKIIDGPRLVTEIVAAGLLLYPDVAARFYGVKSNMVPPDSWDSIVLLYDDVTQSEIDTVDAVVAAHIPIPLPVIVQPVDEDGKPYVRTEIRPIDCTTMFTSRGDKIDAPQEIGTGVSTLWDSSSVGWTTEGAPSGWKRKIIDLQFIDSIYVTAGLCMYENVPFGSTLGMWVMYEAEPGAFVAVDHFVSDWPMSGTCTGGSTIDSSTISSALPPYLTLRFIITVPEDETTAKGSAALKIYRERTVIS